MRESQSDERERARTFVVNSLGARVQSVAEIEAKLARRGVPAGVAASVVADARALGYLDDAELAGQLARGFRLRGYGRRRAAVSLRRRLLDAATAEAALEAAFAEGDEAELAAAALGTRPVADPRERQRAVAYLVRRGFSTGVAWDVVRRRGEADR